MSEATEAFDGLNKAFNTEFDEVEKLNNQINDIKNKLQAANEINNPTVAEEKINVINDEDYIRTELKNAIANAKIVMKKLETDIKVGSNPRAHEVYAKLLESVTKSVAELRTLNVSVTDLKLKGLAVGGVSGSGGNKISLTPNQLMDMMDRVRKENKFNAIEVDFKVDVNEDLK